MHFSLLTDGIYPIKMGGMQKHSYYLAKYLARKGVKVDIYHAITDTFHHEQLETFFSSEELESLRFFAVLFPRNHYFPGHYLWESYIYSKRVYTKWLKQPEPDFIYVQGFAGWRLLRKGRIWSIESRKKKQQPSTFDSLASTSQKTIPVGINFHGVEMFQKAPNVRVKLEHLLLLRPVKWNLRKADFIFSLGGQLSNLQKKASPLNQIITIPIGITKDWLNERHSYLQQNSIRKLVFIGRYERRKGIEELNEVLSELINKSIPSFEMHFIGPIPEKKQIKYSSNIIYYGAIHEEQRIKQILNDCDVLICPSWSEGMPTVILEAMARSCAIIATNVGAVNEQVSSDNGILISPGNKKELKNAIIAMLKLPPEKLQSMKTASVNKVKKKFLWEQVADRTIREIEKIISSKKNSD